MQKLYRRPPALREGQAHRLPSGRSGISSPRLAELTPRLPRLRLHTCRMTLQGLAQYGESRGQMALIGLVPAERSCGNHGIVTFGAVYWLNVGLAGFVSACRGLSAPSTCTRTRYSPAATPLMGMVIVVLVTGASGTSLEGASKRYARAGRLPGGLAYSVTARRAALSQSVEPRCPAPGCWSRSPP